jgi:hypothetical protein
MLIPGWGRSAAGSIHGCGCCHWAGLVLSGGAVPFDSARLVENDAGLLSELGPSDRPRPVAPGFEHPVTRDRLGQVDGGSGAWVVAQCLGQFATAGDPEFFVSALQVIFDGSHR